MKYMIKEAISLEKVKSAVESRFKFIDSISLNSENFADPRIYNAVRTKTDKQLKSIGNSVSRRISKGLGDMRKVEPPWLGEQGEYPSMGQIMSHNDVIQRKDDRIADLISIEKYVKKTKIPTFKLKDLA